MRSLLVFALGAMSVHAQSSLTLDLGGGQSLELIRIEPGAFTQGSPTTEAGRGTDEDAHSVTLTKGYFLGKYPVTRGQFARFVQATGYRTEAERGNSGGFGWEGGKLVQNKRYTWRDPGFPQTNEHPVVIVDFADATAFCQWVSRQTGRPVNLPTEAQWEYASRGGPSPGTTGESWHAGNSPGGTQPVGQAAPNALGLYDLLGNTWEWCADWYAPYPAQAVTDPLQSNSRLSDKPRRVLRGGAFSRPATDARPARRYRNDPGSRNADNGFRVVALEAAPTTPPPAPRPSTPTPLELDDSNRQSPPAIQPTPSHRVPSSFHHDFEESRASHNNVRNWFIFGAILLVGWKIVRFVSARSTPSPYRPAPGSPRVNRPGGARSPLGVRVVQDGFWVSGAQPSGTRLLARWRGASTSHTRTVIYAPGPDGQFIFTGHLPSDVVVELDSDQSRSSSFVDDGPSRFQSDEAPRRRSSGFPSAY